MPNQEEWKPVIGYEGLYDVSNFGQVRSLGRIKQYMQFTHGKWVNATMNRPQTTMTPRLKRSGYFVVQLYDVAGKCKFPSIHRLVAQAFIPNPDNLPQVNHKDENKQNNNVGNLEWCTGLYNMNYGTLPQRLSMQPTCQKRLIAQIDSNGNILRVFCSQNIAAKFFNTYKDAIRNVCTGVWADINGITLRYATPNEYGLYMDK